MKTVPRNVQVVTQEQAVEVAGLPPEVTLALTDIAGAAREGLLAMSVAAGMAVMQTIFEAEITAAAGPKGKHDPDRSVVRHGSETGSVTLGGRRVPVSRPRARTLDGHEVPLTSYAQFAADDLLGRVVAERMLAGIATRRHAGIGEPVGTEVTGAATCTGRSAVSRRFVKQTETALAELLSRELSGEDIKVLMIDGEHMAEHCVIVALAITADGRKLPVGLWEGATENKTMVRAMLVDLVDRGLVRRERSAGRARRRESSHGGGAGSVREPGCGATLHFAQAAECRRSPAREGESVGRCETRQGVHPP
jgi:transposase-like protein